MQSYKNGIRISEYNGSLDALQSNSVSFTPMFDSISISQCGIIFGEVIQHWGATKTHINNHQYYRIDLQIDIWVFLHMGCPQKSFPNANTFLNNQGELGISFQWGPVSRSSYSIVLKSKYDVNVRKHEYDWIKLDFMNLQWIQMLI